MRMCVAFSVFQKMYSFILLPAYDHSSTHFIPHSIAYVAKVWEDAWDESNSENVFQSTIKKKKRIDKFFLGTLVAASNLSFCSKMKH